MGHALLVLPAHWAHSMQESSLTAPDNYYNECRGLDTQMLLQKIAYKQTEKSSMTAVSFIYALDESGFDIWHTMAIIR